MSRRKKKHEHTNHERWLVSYADFITLLFAFFVVMFSASQVDEQKVGKLAMAMQVAFQELGIFSTSGSTLPLASDEAGMPSNDAQLLENTIRTTDLGRLVSLPDGELTEPSLNRDLEELQRELEESLAPEIQRQELALETQGVNLILSLREVGFFDSGVATLRPDSEESLARIARILALRPHAVRIEGHTDNVPINTARFASNWELSTARAVEITKVLITRHGLSPRRLSAAGYAEFRPVADNRTAEGRALNRRVDVVITGAPPPAPSVQTLSLP